jgi:hypothetical protein
LAGGPGFGEYVLEMRFKGRFGYPENGRHFGTDTNCERSSKNAGSPGVSWKSLHIVSSGTGRSSAAFRTNRATTAE